jgi:bacterioferritin-associated ferredoxin
MILCSCTGLTDRDVWEAVEGGHRDLDALRAKLGIAAQCGGCNEQATSLLKAINEHLDNLPVHA